MCRQFPIPTSHIFQPLFPHEKMARLILGNHYPVVIKLFWKPLIAKSCNHIPRQINSYRFNMCKRVNKADPILQRPTFSTSGNISSSNSFHTSRGLFRDNNIFAIQPRKLPLTVQTRRRERQARFPPRIPFQQTHYRRATNAVDVTKHRLVFHAHGMLPPTFARILDKCRESIEDPQGPTSTRGLFFGNMSISISNSGVGTFFFYRNGLVGAT
mmetsp:Transcript_18426/g.29980  ORF Transcript_18426/g.29980 Transcript_18426/m.29980 type:complete len:213 (-) Transcript_18426:76-714(-)